jgi:hypothetical protein
MLAASVAGGGMVVLTWGAGPILSIFDGSYAQFGAGSLRLIGLSLPFTGIFILYGAFSVMEKRMWRMVGIQLTGATGFLAGTWFGLPRVGLIAPAMALLISQAAVGIVLLPGLIRKYRAVTGPGRAPAWAAPDVAQQQAKPRNRRVHTWEERNRADPRHTADPYRGTARYGSGRTTNRTRAGHAVTRTELDRATAWTESEDRDPVHAHRGLRC